MVQHATYLYETALELCVDSSRNETKYNVNHKRIQNPIKHLTLSAW